MEKKSYHHGDLRAALLKAAEEVLSETGIEGFSLRAVAKRAGVSHAAPAHHFTDVKGLLTALAADGFRRFLEAQRKRETGADASPRAQLVAAGLGYIDFAITNPALFRLLFSSDRPDFDHPDLARGAGDAYQHLVEQVRATEAAENLPEDHANVVGAWAIAHGLADLLSSHRLYRTWAMPEPERSDFLAAIISRNICAVRDA